MLYYSSSFSIPRPLTNHSESKRKSMLLLSSIKKRSSYWTTFIPLSYTLNKFSYDIMPSTCRKKKREISIPKKEKKKFRDRIDINATFEKQINVILRLFDAQSHLMQSLLIDLTSVAPFYNVQLLRLKVTQDI
jgi:hypothetical protein